MNAIELLKQQHKEVLRLMNELKNEQDSAQKQELFDQCADTLALHLLLEEQSFYPAVNSDETEDMLLEAVEEHLAAKRVLADMIDSDVDDKSFPAKLEVLQVTVQHHINEEEQHMFPQLQKSLSSQKLSSLGDELEEAQQDLLGQGDIKSQIPDQTDAPASI